MTDLHPALTFNGLRTAQTGRGLDPYAFAAYMAIALSADGYTGTTTPLSYKTIGERSGMTARHARTCIKRLVTAGLLRVETQKTAAGDSDSNRYTLVLGGEQCSLPPAEVRNNVPNPDEQYAEGVRNNVHGGREQRSYYKDKEERMTTGRSVQDNDTGVGVVVHDQQPADPIYVELLDLYAAEIGPATPIAAGELRTLFDRYGAEDVRDAIRTAVLANARKLGHVKGTLRNREREGKLLRDGQRVLMPIAEAPRMKTPAAKNDLHTGAAAGLTAFERLQAGLPIEARTDAPAPCPERAAWDAAYDQLRRHLDGGRFETWLEGAQFLRMDGGAFVIGVRSGAAVQMLQHRLYRVVARVLGDVWGQPAEILFESADAGAGFAPASAGLPDWARAGVG